MKLNRKGYMLVEIIVSFSVAMGIAFYLINLTYKFVDNNDNIYQDSLYMRDKVLVTKNIMNDLDNWVVVGNLPVNKNVDNNSCSCEFTLQSISNDDEEKRKLVINNRTIEYGKWDSGFDNSKVSYYKKEIEDSLQVDFNNFRCEIRKFNNNNNAILIIKIPLRSIYSDEVYDIKLMAKVS